MILNAIREKDEFGYFAYVPALEGCVSQGKSYEEALANINEAAKLYLESIDEKEIAKISAKHASIVPLEVTLHDLVSKT